MLPEAMASKLPVPPVTLDEPASHGVPTVRISQLTGLKMSYCGAGGINVVPSMDSKLPLARLTAAREVAAARSSKTAAGSARTMRRLGGIGDRKSVGAPERIRALR